MKNDLVSVVIVTRNRTKELADCVKSYLNSSYKPIEIIVVDNGSQTPVKHWLSKKFKNNDYFLKLNKGIELANGEIIAILKPDTAYFDKDIIDTVVQTMQTEKTDVCWGDLIYFGNRTSNNITMYWKSSKFKGNIFRRGWSPPFPTFFIKKSLFKKYGLFNNNFQIAAEYELMLRLLEVHQVKSSYIPRILVKMVGRGITIKNISDRITGNFETHKAWNVNRLQTPPGLLMSKNITKLFQLWRG